MEQSPAVGMQNVLPLYGSPAEKAVSESGGVWLGWCRVCVGEVPMMYPCPLYADRAALSLIGN